MKEDLRAWSANANNRILLKELCGGALSSTLAIGHTYCDVNNTCQRMFKNPFDCLL